MSALRRLNLRFAASHASTVTSLLVERRPALPPFSVQKAEGYGDEPGRLAGTGRTDGPVDQRILSLVLTEREAIDVIALLCVRACSVPIAWWTERIESFGMLR